MYQFWYFYGRGGQFWKISILKGWSCLLMSHSKGLCDLIFGNVEIWVLQRILHCILILNRKNIDFVFQSYSQLMLKNWGSPYFVISENQLKSYNYQNCMMHYLKCKSGSCYKYYFRSMQYKFVLFKSQPYKCLRCKNGGWKPRF